MPVIVLRQEPSNQTSLETLSLEKCLISPVGLGAALRAPRGLKFLSFCGVEWDHMDADNNADADADANADADEDADQAPPKLYGACLEEFILALKVQRDSLVGIRIVFDDVCDEKDEAQNKHSINSEDFLPSTKQFPKLTK